MTRQTATPERGKVAPQRDRLAAVLHQMACVCGNGPDEDDLASADALLARGVRVVDEETLAALRELANGNYVGSECIWCMTSFSHNERCPVKRVAAILAALDAEP